jgi:hypothetical protein
VTQTSPANLTPIVEDVATNTRLTAKFSQAMLMSSFSTSSFTVSCTSGTPISGAITYDEVKNLAVLQPSQLLDINATCEAKISAAVTNLAGVPMAADYTWRFITGAGADNTRPSVLVARSPALGELGLCLSKSVSITFSEPMDPTTINASTFFVTDPAPSNTHVVGDVAYDELSKTATFSVTNPPGFVATTLYTTHVTTGAQDLAGNALSSENIGTFTTSTSACAPLETVDLGSIATYGAFGGNAGVTNSGVHTIVNGNLGTTAACTLFTGFHDAHNVYTETPLNIGHVTGDIYCDLPSPGTLEKFLLATQAASDALTAYYVLEAKAPTGQLGLAAGELGGQTVAPGIYKPSTSSAILSTGNLTLDAAGDANAIWIFQIATSLTVGESATPRSVILVNGAQAKNVFWQVGSAARIEDGSTMVGTIIARSGVTISTANPNIQTQLTGRAIGLNASVTMVDTTILAP